MVDTIKVTGAASVRLSPLQIFAYGSIMLPLAIGFSNLIMIIPTYYGINVKVGLGLAGIMLAVGRVFDFITDPLLGDLSDRSEGLLKSRKLWVMGGLILFCMSCLGLFMPSETAGAGYLLIMACLYFLSFTLVDVPLSAIGLEISQHTHERTRLAGSKAFHFLIGGVIGALFPTIWSDDLSLALKFAGWAIIIASCLVLPLFLICVQSDNRRQSIRSRNIVSVNYALLKNYNIRRIMSIFFLLISASAISGSLALLYVSHVIKAPQLIGPVWMINGVGLIIGVPLWYYISKYLGKIRTWRQSVLWGFVLGLPLLFLGDGDIGILLGLAFVLGVCRAAEIMMPTSMLADHVVEWKKSGKAGQAGRIAGLKNAISKLSIIAPLAIIFPVLEALGVYSAGDGIMERSLTLTRLQHFSLIGFYAGLPLALRLVALVLMPKLWPEVWQRSIQG